MKVFFEYPIKAVADRRCDASVDIGGYVHTDFNEHDRSSLIRELVKRFGGEFGEAVKKLLSTCMKAYNTINIRGMRRRESAKIN